MLTEIERYDGLVILATNRAADIDEVSYTFSSLALSVTHSFAQFSAPLLLRHPFSDFGVLPLSKAMHRRISLAIEFQKPNHVLREAIWSSLQPRKLRGLTTWI